MLTRSSAEILGDTDNPVVGSPDGSPNGEPSDPVKYPLDTFKDNFQYGDGIDESLPPLIKISDIFSDMIKRVRAEGFDDAVKHLNGRKLKIATMCSGTESPVLALDLTAQSKSSSNLTNLANTEALTCLQISRDMEWPLKLSICSVLKLWFSNSIISKPTSGRQYSSEISPS